MQVLGQMAGIFTEIKNFNFFENHDNPIVKANFLDLPEML
jgi:hypothetical protein